MTVLFRSHAPFDAADWLRKRAITLRAI